MARSDERRTRATTWTQARSNSGLSIANRPNRRQEATATRPYRLRRAILGRALAPPRISNCDEPELEHRLFRPFRAMDHFEDGLPRASPWAIEWRAFSPWESTALRTSESTALRTGESAALRTSGSEDC